ncbi:DEAD/DEAH box helicase [Streptomyces sp. NPDC004752]
MRPTLAAEQVGDSLTQYLTTTFALADEGERRALEDFLRDDQDGIFRGPYLRIRTPFKPAGKAWKPALEWVPEGFAPYRHQAQAWQRLSTLRGPARPTLITTGTGSGKTESFLVPVLDHCRRARAAGQDGVKAVLLYPMNALATDQAQRIDDQLKDPRLAQVSAALYIGDEPATGYTHVATDRADIRGGRPDILITNYKMLDLLLQRAEDLPLWQDEALAYVVVDEFHTYDGAQGTDVAMLMRRLGAATGKARPGRPLGDVCPVATSATLGASAPSVTGAFPLPTAEGGGTILRAPRLTPRSSARRSARTR